MRTCPTCTTELVVDGGERCPVCNALLTTDASSHSAPADDDMRFEITEAHDEPRDLLGGAKRAALRDDLGIEREADITAGQAGSFAAPPRLDTCPTTLNDEPLPLAPAAADFPRSRPADKPSAPDEEKNGVKKLSAQEIESISKNLYGGHSGSQSYLSEREKLDLLKKVESSAKPASATARAQQAPDLPSDKPRMAKRIRGVAWFYKNWIQVVGEHDLKEYDEIVIGDRPYALRKKRFSPKFVLAAIAPVAVVALFAVASILTPSFTGKGRIVGFVLDQNGRSIRQSATVRLPDADQTVQTNAQGFFVTDPVKSGPHKVEFLINGQVAGSNFVTVVANEISTLTLAPSAVESSQPPASAGAQPETGSLNTLSAVGQKSAAPSVQPGRTSEAAQQRRYSGESTERAVTDPNGRIVLDANIEGATLALNGRVVGAGNMIYTRLKPGRYDYQVSKDGYQSAHGTVEVAAGDASTLSVQLAALRTAEKPSVSPEEDHYRAGMDALGASNYAVAESELTAAVAAKPSYAAAYMGLGQTKTQNGRRADASDDFLRAAEIYRVAGDPSNALKAYNHAVQANQTSVPALLGRGNLYLSRGEEIAAIADYETLLKFDRRNVQVYLGLGQARFSQGNPKAAIKHFKDARSIDPKNAGTYEYLMLCYFAEDDFKEARKAYEDYKEIATSEQITRIQHNPKFSAVLRVVGE